MSRKGNYAYLPKGVRIVFGIMMVLIYLGVGTLFLSDVFQLLNQTVSITVGIILIVYGFWRGYRLYKGENTYYNGDKDND